MTIAAIVVGAALLFLGRRLFWLFVGGVGFVAGMMLASVFLEGQSEMMALLIALVVGLIGALLAIFLQKLAVGIGGFFAGAYILFNLAWRFDQEQYAWVAFILGGILGALLVLALFDWALILLSSLTGATAIARVLPLEPAITLILFVVLVVAGIATQAAQLRRKPARQPARAAGV
jgi:MFS family permease